MAALTARLLSLPAAARLLIAAPAPSPGLRPVQIRRTSCSGTVPSTGLTAGTYTDTVSDSHGCTATTSVTISEPAALSAGSSVVTNVSCNGGSNGSASVSASGGTAPYSGTGTFTGLTAGTYTYTVSDSHGIGTTNFCTTITSTALMPSTALIKKETCNDSSKGTSTY